MVMPLVAILAACRLSYAFTLEITIRLFLPHDQKMIIYFVVPMHLREFWLDFLTYSLVEFSVAGFLEVGIWSTLSSCCDQGTLMSVCRIRLPLVGVIFNPLD